MRRFYIAVDNGINGGVIILDTQDPDNTRKVRCVARKQLTSGNVLDYVVMQQNVLEAMTDGELFAKWD